MSARWPGECLEQRPISARPSPLASPVGMSPAISFSFDKSPASSSASKSGTRLRKACRGTRQASSSCRASPVYSAGDHQVASRRDRLEAAWDYFRLYCPFVAAARIFILIAAPFLPLHPHLDRRATWRCLDFLCYHESVRARHAARTPQLRAA